MERFADGDGGYGAEGTRQGVTRGVQLLLMLAVASALHAQTLDPALKLKVDEAVTRCLREDGVPSLSVAIVKDDHVAYAKAVGQASLAPALAATPATHYQLASVSKTFTAQAVLQLVAQGKLTLDDPISRWFPDVTEAAHISVRQLLSHTAGLQDHYPEGYPAGPKARATTPDAIIAEYGRHPLQSAPGTQFHYSNLDYEIAGRIVEKVSGQPLFAYLQAHVFAPAGMVAALDLDTIPDGSRALATGYVQVGLSPLEPAPYEGPGWSFGAGQVVETAEDVARWDVAFLKHQVLPAAVAKDEVTRVPLAGGGTGPAGLGLFVGDEDGLTRYYHGGQGLGFTSINLIYPAAHVAVVVLANTSVTGTVGKLADQLTYLLVAPSTKDAMARRVFAGLQAGSPDITLFAPDLKEYLTPAMLGSYRKSLAPLGPVQSFTARRAQTTDGLESRDYDVEAGGHRLRMHLLVRGDGLLEDASVADGEKR